MFTSRYSTVNIPPRIISTSNGRMAPSTLTALSVMPTICSHLPLHFLACNALRTLFRSSPWFSISRLPHQNSGRSTTEGYRNSKTTRSLGWVPQEVPIQNQGTFKCLVGVIYPINPIDSTSLQILKQKLIDTSHPCPVHQASVSTRHQSGDG